MEIKCGLIGEKLSHSYSKKIHEMLGYSYELYPTKRENLEKIVRDFDYTGMNVTIPYKTDVIPFCSQISDKAKKIGAVNTLLKSSGGIKGFNTDYFGFCSLAEKCGISFKNKTVLILGTGGTSKTVFAAASDSGASKIRFVSRSGELNYENVYENAADAEIIVNTTPIGMFPDIYRKPLSLKNFKNLCGVLDVIYNPLRTELITEALSLGLNAGGGLYMLAAQGVRAGEIFTSKNFGSGKTDEIYKTLLRDTENIVLTGMPGCGKSTFAKIIAKKTGKHLVDTDAEVVKSEGMNIPDIFSKFGEEYFRNAETAAIKKAAAGHSQIIATGGGAVLREENMKALSQNGHIYYIDRSTDLLASDGRPLSKNPEVLKKMYSERLPLYRKYADEEIKNDGAVSTAAEKILSRYI